ncbi:right-handed parallel beta-helix repeat-containing protein [Nonomuraea sp. NPDC003804]|uniref:right-handed parallel beta-helix repeat-containing protein n=1 Tax=Nonomuraea sp. NPDC003804 TaxID=3154547 RepID=UPI0033B184F7
MTHQETSRRSVLAGLGLAAAAAAPMVAVAPPAQAATPENAAAVNSINLYPADAYGAVADGVADDSAALQRAIDAAAAAGGGTVVLRAGKQYLLGKSLQLKTGVALASDRARATLVLTSGYADPHVLAVKDVSVVTLRNLKLDCGERRPLLAGVHVTASTDVILDNLHVEGLTAGAYDRPSGVGSTALVRIGDSHRVQVVGCRLTKGYIGLNVVGNSTHILIDDCDVHDLSQFGMHVHGTVDSHTEHLTISRCRVERIGGGPHPEFSGTPIYITSGGTIHPGAQKHRFVRATDNTLIGNFKAFFFGGNADMLAVYDIHDGFFDRNVIFGGGDAGLSTDRCRKLVIANNIVGHCNTVGINVWEAVDCTVVGNVVYNNYQNFDGHLKAEDRGGIRTYARDGKKSENIVIVGNRSFDDQATKTQDFGIFIHPRTRGVDIGANTLTGNKTGLFKTKSAEDITFSFVVTLDALPTTGWWDKNMVVQLRNPAPGQPSRWICTVAGTPGTWRPEAALDVPAVITAAPAYAGQLALANNALYVAKGTASAADWRKVGDLA